MGAAGRWLEVSYGVSCDSDRYNAYVTGTAVTALLYSVGIPGAFYVLIRRFEDQGKRGDKVVQSALGPFYEPYRVGCEWWLIAEMGRILVLTSTVGFLSKSCHVKMMVAQMMGMPLPWL